MICEGYSGIRIRTDDPYIRNVASGGASYIVWLYAALELRDNTTDSTQHTNIEPHPDESNDPVTFDMISNKLKVAFKTAFTWSDS